MANKVLGKINSRLKFLHRQSEFLSKDLRRMLCNALIQPHFDFASCAWFPCLTKKFTQKLNVAQNKCIRFCLLLGNRNHIGFNEFEKINWLPIKYRNKQSNCSLVHNFFQNKCPNYMSDTFTVNENQTRTRNSSLQLNKPVCKTNGQNSLSFLGPDSWNEIPPDMRRTENLNTFKHKLKKWYFDKLKFHEENPFLLL